MPSQTIEVQSTGTFRRLDSCLPDSRFTISACDDCTGAAVVGAALTATVQKFMTAFSDLVVMMSRLDVEELRSTIKPVAPQ